MDYDFNIAWQGVDCLDCGYEWDEVYNFDRCEASGTSKEIDENGNILPERDLWGNDPRHPRADWKYEVVNGDTNLGYWDWVENQLLMEESEKNEN
jgi:hypothetical protein